MTKTISLPGKKVLGWVPERLRAQFSTHHVKNFDKEEELTLPCASGFRAGAGVCQNAWPPWPWAHQHMRINGEAPPLDQDGWAICCRDSPIMKPTLDRVG